MLYFNAIEPFTLELLNSLMIWEYIQQFVLVGGTALALHLGHRKSVDLDFQLQKFDIDYLLSLYHEKYTHQTTFHVIRSMTWFKDAGHDPDPIVFDPEVTWVKVKNKIVKEIQKL